ncbi:hypothetical protein DL93DRAFT_2082226 [Clavulina sp. PMI_390]|nr:hypothetical protein DL93DRAFT_2082226 [Clavulina sp. PMI_390]
MERHILRLDAGDITVRKLPNRLTMPPGPFATLLLFYFIPRTADKLTILPGHAATPTMIAALPSNFITRHSSHHNTPTSPPPDQSCVT